MLAVATAVGAIVLVPMLKLGPEVSALSAWANHSSAPTIEILYASKVAALEANLKRLTVMRVAFYAQSAMVAVAVSLSVAASRGGG